MWLVHQAAILCILCFLYTLADDGVPSKSFRVNKADLSRISYSNFSELLGFASNGGRRWVSSPEGMKQASLVFYFSQMLSRDSQYAKHSVVLVGDIMVLAMLASWGGNEAIMITRSNSPRDYSVAQKELKMSDNDWRKAVRFAGGGNIIRRSTKMPLSPADLEIVCKAAVVILEQFSAELMDSFLSCSQFNGIVIVLDAIGKTKQLEDYICKTSTLTHELEVFDGGRAGVHQSMIFTVRVQLQIDSSGVEKSSEFNKISLPEIYCKELTNSLILTNNQLLVLKTLYEKRSEVGTLDGPLLCFASGTYSQITMGFVAHFGEAFSKYVGYYIAYGRNPVVQAGLLSSLGHEVLLYFVETGDVGSKGMLGSSKYTRYKRVFSCILAERGGGAEINMILDYNVTGEMSRNMERSILIVSDGVYPHLVEALIGFQYRGVLVVEVIDKSIWPGEKKLLQQMVCKYGVVDYRVRRKINIYEFYDAGNSVFSAILDFSQTLQIRETNMEKSTIPPMSLSADACTRLE